MIAFLLRQPLVIGLVIGLVVYAGVFIYNDLNDHFAPHPWYRDPLYWAGIFTIVTVTLLYLMKAMEALKVRKSKRKDQKFITSEHKTRKKWELQAKHEALREADDYERQIKMEKRNEDLLRTQGVITIKMPKFLNLKKFSELADYFIKKVPKGKEIFNREVEPIKTIRGQQTILRKLLVKHKVGKPLFWTTSVRQYY